MTHGKTPKHATWVQVGRAWQLRTAYRTVAELVPNGSACGWLSLIWEDAECGWHAVDFLNLVQAKACILRWWGAYRSDRNRGRYMRFSDC